MKVINLPIEPLEERYSIQWDTWFQMEFVHAFGQNDVVTIYGDPSTGVIESGSFLDVLDTNIYKASQAKNLFSFLRTYNGTDRLVIFFHDLWNPLIANLAYIRDGMGWTNIKICGCLHAGSYDYHDFLSKKKMTKWAEALENSIFSIVDRIFVATNFHKKIVSCRRLVNPGKIFVTGFPIYPKDFVQLGKPYLEREHLVVFPHRMDEEKHPERFFSLKYYATNPETGFYKKARFVFTKQKTKTKKEYYELLSQARFAISFAAQETWGIAMQEATFSSAIPLVPDCLSYSELYPDCFKYKDEKDLWMKLVAYSKEPPLQELFNLQISLRNAGEKAISRMISIIKE